MNSRVLWALLLLSAVAIAWTAVGPPLTSATGPAAKAPWEKTGGVSFIVQFDRHSATILSAKPTSRAPSLKHLHGPLVNAKTSRDYPVGTQELLVAAYRQDGTLVRTLAWPSRAIVFHDEADPVRRGAIRGRALPPRVDQRFLDIPLTAEGSYLAFFRSTIVPPGKLPPVSFEDNPCLVGGLPPRTPTGPVEGTNPVVVSFLAMYSLFPFPGSGDPEAGGLVIPRPTPPTGFHPPIPGPPDFRISPECISHLPKVDPGTKIFCGPPDGTFLSTETRQPAAIPTESFDVVILGDGFTSAEMGRFETWAKKVEAGLLNSEPFHSLANKISFHWVRTSSLEKGITHCWGDYENRCADKTVKTYYGVEGMWTDPTGEKGGPGYFGTPNLCIVNHAVERVAPRDQIELVIVLANCSRYGGDADMQNGIAYLPLFDDRYTAEKFEDLAVHESSHVVAALGDEYVSCLSPDFLRIFPNIATEQEVILDAVWWKALARPEELQNGQFMAVHRCGDPFDCACLPQLTPPELRDMLGLFWGAQYGACECPAVATDCPQSYWCAASCGYYRPQRTCKMRELRDENGNAVPFCRACEAKLREAILAATTAP